MDLRRALDRRLLFADGAVAFISDSVSNTVTGQLSNRCDRGPRVVDVSRY